MAGQTDSGRPDAELVRQSLLGAKDPFALNVSRRWLYQLRREIPGLQPDDLASDAPGPAEIAAAADLASRVRDAIATLPSGQRDAVLLFYLQGLGHREAAAELGTSAGAVKVRLHQARTNLALSLSPLADLLEGTTMNQAGAPEWIDVSVAEVRRTDAPHPKHLMLLHERGGDRRLAIWIGPAEATAMVISLESVEHPRPMAYGFTASLLAAAGAPVREIRITRLTPPIYYATVIVAGPNGLQEVDARPSDAVNLALVTGVPIRADSRLFGDCRQNIMPTPCPIPPAQPSWPLSSVSFSRNFCTSWIPPTGSAPPTPRSGPRRLRPSSAIRAPDTPH